MWEFFYVHSYSEMMLVIIFCYTILIKEVEDFMENQEVLKTSKNIINTFIRLIREGDYVFRGVSRTNELLPKINRVFINGVLKDLNQKEGHLLYDFKRYSTSFLSGSLELLDIVAYAQHFGLPTRLIDWTRDPFVALFFAISNNHEPDEGSYKIYYTKLSDNIVVTRDYTPLIAVNYSQDFPAKWEMFVSSLQNKQKIIEHIVDGAERYGYPYTKLPSVKSLVFYDSSPSNPRLIAQQGLFSIPTSIGGRDAEKEILDNSHHFEIKLDKKERIELLKYLENMNYTHLRLFPDLENISNYIVKKHFD